MHEIDRYDIGKYVTRCCSMDLLDVIEYTRKEVNSLSLISPRSRSTHHIEDSIMVYRSFLDDFLQFITGAPIGIITEYNRDRVKPIIQHFVDNNQMQKSVLKLFE